MLSGHYRVLGCAKARVIELQTAVAVVGADGSPRGLPVSGHGGWRGRCLHPSRGEPRHDRGRGGVRPAASRSRASPTLAHHVPLSACQRIRHGVAEAEVWPGSGPLTTSRLRTELDELQPERNH